jgi:hypothetical protein
MIDTNERKQSIKASSIEADNTINVQINPEFRRPPSLYEGPFTTTTEATGSCN